jgi:hypothetical protein
MNKVILVGILFISLNTSYAQTQEKKNNLSIGGGQGAYNGDLGNAWFVSDEEWYGFIALHYSRFINKSFDMTSSITFGDLGHCREEDESQFRSDGSEVLNMLSRLTSVVFSLKYKFANGYILKENARLSPYVYLGVGVNNISEYWWSNKNRAIVGNYGSLNGGLGIRYNFLEKYNFTYNMGIGYFTSDKIDNRVEGRNDMFMQQTILLGMNF